MHGSEKLSLTLKKEHKLQLKITVFCDVALYSLIDIYYRFGGFLQFCPPFPI
jgi:hypothetical protein